MAIVYLNIGSNLGNRENNIEKALDKIGDLFGYYGVSEIIETEAWGFDSRQKFLNIGVVIRTFLEPEKLLERIKSIEKKISDMSHRDSDGKYADREIDIDIMAIEGLKYESGKLQVPHRYLKARKFFLQPLYELNPEWRDPESGETVSDLLSRIG